MNLNYTSFAVWQSLKPYEYQAALANTSIYTRNLRHSYHYYARTHVTIKRPYNFNSHNPSTRIIKKYDTCAACFGFNLFCSNQIGKYTKKHNSSNSNMQYNKIYISYVKLASYLSKQTTDNLKVIRCIAPHTTNNSSESPTRSSKYHRILADALLCIKNRLLLSYWLSNRSLTHNLM